LNRLWCCFLEALFSETANVIKGFNVETGKLAEHLHQYFSSGMTFDNHGKNRRSLYEKVVRKAEEVWPFRILCGTPWLHLSLPEI
jgi:hypothetical protein